MMPSRHAAPAPTPEVLRELCWQCDCALASAGLSLIISLALLLANLGGSTVAIEDTRRAIQEHRRLLSETSTERRNVEQVLQQNRVELERLKKTVNIAP